MCRSLLTSMHATSVAVSDAAKVLESAQQPGCLVLSWAGLSATQTTAAPHPKTHKARPTRLPCLLAHARLFPRPSSTRADAAVSRLHRHRGQPLAAVVLTTPLQPCLQAQAAP